MVILAWFVIIISALLIIGIITSDTDWASGMLGVVYFISIIIIALKLIELI